MPNSENLKILYAEDEKLARMMITRVISHRYKNIESAEDGLAALELFKEYEPDVLITDLAMPRMTGFELIEKVREINPDIPVVVTTAYREEASKITDAEILYKPIDKNELFEAIETSMNKLNK